MKDFVFAIDVCLQVLAFSAVIWKLFVITHELQTGQVRNRDNITNLADKLDNLERALLLSRCSYWDSNNQRCTNQRNLDTQK